MIVPLWLDLGLQERDGKMCYVSIHKGSELLTNAELACKSGSKRNFRFSADKARMTYEELEELFKVLPERNDVVASADYHIKQYRLLLKEKAGDMTPIHSEDGVRHKGWESYLKHTIRGILLKKAMYPTLFHPKA